MAAARLPNLGEMAIAPLFIGPFAAGLTERDGNFSQICRGETRNKAERNERNILTLGRKSTFAPIYGACTYLHPYVDDDDDDRGLRSARDGRLDGSSAAGGGGQHRRRRDHERSRSA